MDPFIIWKKHVKTSDYDEALNMYMELFDLAVFEQPKGVGAQRFLNQYWQAKYGFFTCYDMWVKWGIVNYDAALIEMWEKPKDLHRQWMLACLSWLSDSYRKSGELKGAIDYR